MFTPNMTNNRDLGEISLLIGINKYYVRTGYKLGK